jgi:acetyl esterase/lipase
MLANICLFLLSSSIALHAAEPDQIIAYKQIEGASLTAHIFNPAGHKSSDRTPAIVLFFGGGWVKGDPTQFYPQSSYLASRGMVAICADYRTKNKHGTTPQECVKDGKSVMRWVRSHADELGIDPEKIAAGGGSAGGQIAAATALSAGFNEAGDDLSISSRPGALVLFNPVIDCGPTGFGYSLVSICWQDFSPINNINTGAPPTLIMLGTQDAVTPVATAQKYETLMNQAGVRCDLCLYEGEVHGFFNKSKYNETLRDAESFLTSLGYLK